MKKLIIFGSLFIAVALILANGYGTIIKNSTAVAGVKTSKSVGEASIGGPFNLVNQNGESVTEKDFYGKVSLVFFGFTNCPEICPNTMMGLSKAMEIIAEDADDIVPVFITVDDENDSVENVKSYLDNFHPSIQGLTGTAEQLKQARDSYRVYAKKVETESMMGTMYNHSTYTYVMDREGKYITHIPYDTKPEDIVAEIKKHL